MIQEMSVRATFQKSLLCLVERLILIITMEIIFWAWIWDKRNLLNLPHFALAWKLW